MWKFEQPPSKSKNIFAIPLEEFLSDYNWEFFGKPVKKSFVINFQGSSETQKVSIDTMIAIQTSSVLRSSSELVSQNNDQRIDHSPEELYQQYLLSQSVSNFQYVSGHGKSLHKLIEIWNHFWHFRYKRIAGWLWRLFCIHIFSYLCIYFYS